MFISREGKLIDTYISTKENIFASNINFQLLTYSREIIFEILKQNNITYKHEVIVPDYVCSTVIETILPFTKNIKFYKINKQIRFDEDEIESLITNNTKVIFFVDYFGIQTTITKSLERTLKTNKICIIKDSAHAFLSLVKCSFKKDYEYDYVISSIYKNLPFQVGAMSIGSFDTKHDFINFKILLKRFLVLFIKNILCLIGLNNYINRNIKDKVITNEKYISYLNSTNISGLYKFILKHFNFSKIIKRKETIAEEFNEYFFNNEIYKPLFSRQQIKSNILQAYPVKCKDKITRDKLLVLLQENSIDAYTWPTFHLINRNSKLWNKILLIPLEEQALNIIKVKNV